MKSFGILTLSILLLLWKCGSDHLVTATSYVFLTEPTSTEVLNGLTGELKCVFANNVDATNCYWLKNHMPVTIVGRYQFKGTPKNGDCSITITGSTLMQDDAEFVCGMPASLDFETGLMSDPPAKYTVLYAPKNPIIKLNGVQIQNGTEINVPNFSYPPKIECKSESGNPGADLQFYLENRSDMLRGNYTLFNDTMMSNKTQTAILQLTEPMDTTWRNMRLSCNATHPAYNTTPVFVYVYIRSPYPPSSVVLTADGNTGEINAETHQQIQLFCTADGYPIPTLTWYRRIKEDDDWVQYTPYLSGYGTANNTVEAVNSQLQCRATSTGYSPIQSNTITIVTGGNVNCTCQENCIRIYGKMNTTVFLVCHLHNPEEQCVWKRNDYDYFDSDLVTYVDKDGKNTENCSISMYISSLYQYACYECINNLNSKTLCLQDAEDKPETGLTPNKNGERSESSINLIILWIFMIPLIIYFKSNV